MTSVRSPGIGEPARSFDLADLEGRRVRFEDLHHRQRIEAAGTAVLVAFDSPQRLRASLLHGLDVPYPVLVDRDRAAYAVWGLGRGSVFDIWADPRVWARYAAELSRGARLRRPGSDMLQLGGDFVVDSSGIVAYARPQRRDDRPPVAELLRALEDAAAASPRTSSSGPASNKAR